MECEGHKHYRRASLTDVKPLIKLYWCNNNRKKCLVLIRLNKAHVPALCNGKQTVSVWLQGTGAMTDTGQKSFTVMLREPDEAFPQKCTIRNTWLRVNNMPLPGFISYYLWIWARRLHSGTLAPTVEYVGFISGIWTSDEIKEMHYMDF